MKYLIVILLLCPILSFADIINCKVVTDSEHSSPVAIGEERYKIDMKRHKLAANLERDFMSKAEENLNKLISL